jgi:hypothetical protein
MSWKATGYVKTLDGMTRSEKLILLIISDYYNEEHGRAWPSVSRLATDAMLTQRQTYRLLESLQRKGFLEIQHAGPGRRSNQYRFPGLVDPHPSQNDTPVMGDRSDLTSHTNVTVSEPSTEEEPRKLFAAIQTKISEIDGLAVEFEIRNIDQYLAKFTGQLPAVDPSNLAWFVAFLDQIRRRFLFSETRAPLRVPSLGRLRAIFPYVREWHEFKTNDWQAAERRWQQVLIAFSESGPRDGSRVLDAICEHLPEVFDAFAQADAIVYSGVD